MSDATLPVPTYADVEAAAAGARKFFERDLPLVAVANVHDVPRRGAVGKHCRGFVDPLRVDIGDADEPALARKMTCDSAADARTAPGDENRFPRHPLPPYIRVSCTRCEAGLSVKRQSWLGAAR